MHTRLRRERLSRGLTLRELAPIVGTTHANLAYLERGKTQNPRPGLRLRLETYFRLHIDVLLAPENGEGPTGAGPSVGVATTHAAAVHASDRGSVHEA